MEILIRFDLNEEILYDFRANLFALFAKEKTHETHVTLISINSFLVNTVAPE